jgi:branched-chain amino acid transport system substrate-binding protein
MNVRRNILVVFVFTLIGIALLMGLSSRPAQAQKPIVIGAVENLTGPFAPIGPQIDKGIRYCLDLAGWKVAGRDIKFIPEDSGTEVNLGLSKAVKLVERDKADLLINDIHSGINTAIAGYLERKRVPAILIHVSTDESALKYHWSWGPYGTLRQQTWPLGYYIYDKMGIRKVTAIVSDFPGGHQFLNGTLEAFKERGGQVIQEQAFPLGTKDFGPYLSALKPADAVAMWAAQGDDIPFFKQYREWNIKMPVYSAEMGTLGDPSYMHNFGDTTIGVAGSSIGIYSVDTPENRAWLKAYQEKFPGEIPNFAYNGYISMSIALAALKATGGDTNPDKLAAALNSVSVDTPFGKISFSPDRLGNKDMYIVELKKIGDKLVPVVIETHRMGNKKVGDKLVPYEIK